MPRRTKGDLWVIEFDSPDSSQCFTNAYHSKQEALQAACDWIAYTAKDELEGIEWDEEEAPRLLNEALTAVKEKRLEDAVSAWLEFQDEYDPSEQIAIGPSGDVGSGANDFAHHVEGPKSNPQKRCDLHEELSECQADPDSCGWAGCDVHEGDACGTPAKHYADTKSFMCAEGRRQFLETYHWDDEVGAWVDRDGEPG